MVSRARVRHRDDGSCTVSLVEGGLGGADRDEQPAVDVEGQVLDVERDKRRTAEARAPREASVPEADQGWRDAERFWGGA